MEEVKNDYIEKALNELIPALGTKEFIDHEKLIGLIGSKKVKEAIKGIALAPPSRGVSNTIFSPLNSI